MKIMAKQYETVIGLEVHVELATETKIFCGCRTAFGGAPNSHTCPVCTGMPGALPVLNKRVVEYAAAVGLATNCSITQECKFDRKNYFYPDNPQNYQISQLYLPICRNGYIDIEILEESNQSDDNINVGDIKSLSDNKVSKRVRIHEIHMEEDAGKLIHENGLTYIDYNRSGVPLIEIVSEPDMRNAAEVIAYLEKLRLIIQYLGVSDCKLYEGSMRADVNLSVRRVGEKKLAARTELKNLNSFAAISRAIKAEAKRQIELVEAGETVIQETRRWDDNVGTSYTMRSKEDAKDYRYFPDPDLPPVRISDEWLNEIRSRQPEFKTERMERYKKEYGLAFEDIDIITNSKKLADLFEEVANDCKQPKKAANWIIGETIRILNDRKMEPKDISFSPQKLSRLIMLVEEGTINGNVAKEIFEKIFEENMDPDEYIELNGLKQVSDEDELNEVIKQVLENNQKSVLDYKSGKKQAMGYLVGQTMKAMKGRANPTVVNALLNKALN